MLMRHLSYFVALSEEGHFGRAAEICNVSQPTLSATIRKLEEDLGVVLISRGHRFVGLTPDGEKALEWGRQILADYDSLKSDLTVTRTGLNGTLRLGAVPAAMPSASFLTSRFSTIHTNVAIEIMSMTSKAIQQGLDTFEIDGGLTYLDNEPLENVRKFGLYHERYVFACRSDHSFANRDAVDWAEAVSQPLCLLSDDMQSRRILNGIASSVGLTVRAPVVSNSPLAVLAHLRDGRLCSIVPHTFCHVFGRSADIAWINLANPDHTQAIGLVLSPRSPQSPMASALVASLKQENFDYDFDIAIRMSS